MRLEAKAFADAPRDLVYRTLSDLANRPAFIAAVAHVELLSDDPVGIGTHYIEGRDMLGRLAALELTVVDYDPPTSLVLSTETSGIGFEISYSLAYTGHETGLRLEVVGTPHTLAARFTALWLGVRARRLRAELEAELSEIAHEAERRYAARRTVIS